MARKRKRYTGEEKLAILRQHLLEGVAVSDICDEQELQPTVFYRWQKQLFEEGAVVFRRTNETEAKRLQRQVTHLEAKLAKKNEVLGELLEEYVALKKLRQQNGLDRRAKRSRVAARCSGGRNHAAQDTPPRTYTY